MTCPICGHGWLIHRSSAGAFCRAYEERRGMCSCTEPLPDRLAFVDVNGRWPLLLPDHRAARPEWPWWEAARLAAMHDRIRPGDIVFDVGAEEGDLPALWATWGATVIPFEPNPRVWPNIRVIWEANDLGAPKAYWAGFAADADCLEPAQMERIFAEAPVDGWPACAYGPVIGDHGFRNVCERSHDTPQITIDTFSARTGLFPDVITMDIEGAELVALRGAAGILAARDTTVFVSVHPAFMADMYGHVPADLHDFMTSLGYAGAHLATDHEEHWCFTPR